MDLKVVSPVDLPTIWTGKGPYMFGVLPFFRRLIFHLDRMTLGGAGTPVSFFQYPPNACTPPSSKILPTTLHGWSEKLSTTPPPPPSRPDPHPLLPVCMNAGAASCGIHPGALLFRTGNKEGGGWGSCARRGSHPSPRQKK
jgi:hypothetical protein